MSNFNFTNKSEYRLNSACTAEMINLYGVPTKFLITEKINIDDNVFGDYSHMKTNSTDIFEIFMLPENSEDWDSSGYNVTEYGLVNFENVILFASKSSFENIDDIDDLDINSIISNLIVFPNNKIMEITNVDFVVPGINNLYTYNDAKSVYKLSCKPYDVKLINELDTTDISADDANPYNTLDEYFDELITDADDQTEEATETLQRTVVEEGDENDTKVEKPYVDTSEESVWGEFD